MHRFFMTFEGPVNFQHLLTRVRQSSHGAFYRVHNERLGRPLQLKGQPYFVEVSPTPDQSGWQVEIRNGHADLESSARQTLQHLFALDVNLTAFYTHAAHDPVLADLTHRLHGARMIRDSNVFISVISSIISQQLNLAFAASLKRRLWGVAGQPLKVDGETFYADPTPQAIARLEYAQLRALQYSQRKAEYVIDFARAVVNGVFSLQELMSLPDEDAISYLVAQRGLGRWTAECVLLFGMGRPDLLPARDVGLQRAVARFYHLAERPTEVELRRLAAKWHPWSSWYTYYLWLGLTLPV